MKAPTLLLVHAHPDDECILTGATMAKVAALGGRMVVVYGTRGDAGETNQDLGGQTLGERRVDEATAACTDLGVERIEWLPYDDSGMAGTETTKNPAAFSNADPALVAAEIASLVADESIDAVIGYDANGTYGHPDHKQVFAVAHALRPLLPAAWMLEATYDREFLATLPDADGTIDPGYASARADLTHFVQGEDLLQAKVAAVSNHRSQVPDDWDEERPDIGGFRSRFGTEWFIAHPALDGRPFGSLDTVFVPKPAWPGPLADPDGD